jgi:hypothetical protein
VSLDRQVETTETISRQTVGATLQDDRTGRKHLHDFANHWAKDAPVGIIIHTIVEREVNGIVLSLGVTTVQYIARSGKVLSELVEGYCHDTVGGIKCFLHSITVMNVDINVENTFVFLEQLQNSQDAIVNVAKARGFSFLGVMETSSPVDDDVYTILIETRGTTNGARRVELTKLEKTVKDGAIFPHVETL